MEKVNISGSIQINLTPDHARQINWGRPGFWKKPPQDAKEYPLIVQIKATPGVSEVFYTDKKDSELLATIKVRSHEEGKRIASMIRGYPGVSGVQVSLGPAGPPPPSPPPRQSSQ